MTEERRLRINDPMNFDIVKPKFALFRVCYTEDLDDMLDIPEGMARYVKFYYEVFLVDLHLAYHAGSAEGLARLIYVYNGVACYNPDGDDVPDDVQEWLDRGPEHNVICDDVDWQMHDVERIISQDTDGDTHRWVYKDDAERDAKMAEHVEDADGDHDKAYALWVEGLREHYQGNHAL